MAIKNLKDRTVKALKAAPKGKILEYWDKSGNGFGVRVSETGRKTFVLVARYPGYSAPARRSLGVYGKITLASARKKAGEWLELIDKGIDPHDEEQRKELEEQKRRANTFTAVAEDFIKEKLSSERRGCDSKRDLRNVFIPKWGGRPITDLTDLDVLGVIKGVKTSAPVRARNLLALLKRFFSWAIDQRVYGLQSSPCERIKPRSLFGEKIPRQRELAEDEIFALWHAADAMPYPHGPIYKLLLLTGLRRNEVANARWSELDRDVDRALRHKQTQADLPIDWSKIDTKRLRWVIPAERMKGSNSRARAHAVPLTPEILEILETLPRQKGDYLFSTTSGAKPVCLGDKIKKQLDKQMRLGLRAWAYSRGDDPAEIELKDWTNHDLRRVISAGMSRLRIPQPVIDAVTAHKPGVIQATYNVDDLFPQKAEALAAWARQLDTIISPQPSNVIPLRAAE